MFVSDGGCLLVILSQTTCLPATRTSTHDSRLTDYYSYLQDHHPGKSARNQSAAPRILPPRLGVFRFTLQSRLDSCLSSLVSRISSLHYSHKDQQFTRTYSRLHGPDSGSSTRSATIEIDSPPSHTVLHSHPGNKKLLSTFMVERISLRRSTLEGTI